MAVDNFASNADSVTSSARRAFAVVPHDVNVFIHLRFLNESATYIKGRVPSRHPACNG